MDRKEMYLCLLILVVATVIGLAIVIYKNETWTQLLFLVIEILALLSVVLIHRRSNIYYCMGCGTKVKIGFIPDIESLTLKNGDKILKCKNCNKKINFRKCEPDEITIIEDGPKPQTEEKNEEKKD